MASLGSQWHLPPAVILQNVSLQRQSHALALLRREPLVHGTALSLDPSRTEKAGNIRELSPAREHPTSAGAERGEAGRGEAGRGEVGACVAPACCVASHGVTGPDMLAVT